MAVGAHRYRWFYVCTFVEPETGESLSLLVDGVDTEVMGWVLRELRAWLGEGEGSCQDVCVSVCVRGAYRS